MTEYVETRKFSAAGVRCDFELDLRTTNKTHVDIRKRHLQRTGYYARLIVDEDEFVHGSSMVPVIVYSLYKCKKSKKAQYYPLSTKLLSKSIGESLS